VAHGVVPAGRNGEAPRPASPPKEDLGAAVGRALAVWGAYAGILALIWVVAVLGLSLYRLNVRSAIGFATVFAAIAAFFVRSLLPLKTEKVQASTAAQPTDSFREVVETVVFVVVLVLLLKSFVAEAFVIPTGSMAETLLGYQKMVTCPQCGLRFPVNCSSEVDPTEGKPDFVSGCTCPNCRQKIQLLRPSASEDAIAAGGVVPIPDPGWSSGDRVLVAKFVYDLLQHQPNRLDVVVFKFPGDDKFPSSGPVKKHIPLNYIKRLIGEPRETIAICRGKLYVLPADKGPQYDDYEKAAGDPSGLMQLWRPSHTHHNALQDRFKEPHSGFEIIRKSPETLLAMMRLVYDNDHQAKDLADKQQFQRWAGEDNSGWAANGKTAFAHDGGNAGKPAAWLRYRNVLRGDDKPQLITTFMGYNSFSGVNGHNAPAENWASDLIAECEVKIDKGQGAFLLELSRGPDRFQARFDLADGECTLSRLHEGREPQVLDHAPSRLKQRGTHQVRFANVDDRLVVWVDDHLVFGDGVAYDMGALRHTLAPTAENDLKRPVSVGSEGAAVLVSKLKVFRDTYYTTQRNEAPNNADVEALRVDDPLTFKEVENAPVSTYYVQPDHFLCLGDNSAESSDGRSWGLVPKRLLLGRALLVYYPFDRAGRIR
jgi:signal peptidase I